MKQIYFRQQAKALSAVNETMLELTCSVYICIQTLAASYNHCNTLLPPTFKAPRCLLIATTTTIDLYSYPDARHCPTQLITIIHLSVGDSLFCAPTHPSTFTGFLGSPRMQSLGLCLGTESVILRFRSSCPHATIDHLVQAALHSRLAPTPENET